MSRWSCRTVVLKHVEFLIPLGSDGAELDRVYVAALDVWMKNNPGYEPHEVPDDWATVTADDEYVIIRVTVREVDK